MKILSLLNVATWTESRVTDALRTRGHEIELRCHATGDPLPDPFDDEFGAFVVNGGLVSTWAAEDHPFMARQIDWAAKVLATDKPYLGFCLGAQILGATQGITSAPRPDEVTEYGFCPIEPVGPVGATLFGGLSRVFQSHYEGLVALPDGAEHLARSDLFEVQGFRMGGDGSAIGLQFHPDARADMIAGWWDGNPETRVRPGVQPLEEQLRWAERLEPERSAFVERLLDLWLAPATGAETG